MYPRDDWKWNIHIIISSNFYLEPPERNISLYNHITVVWSGMLLLLHLSLINYWLTVAPRGAGGSVITGSPPIWHKDNMSLDGSLIEAQCRVHSDPPFDRTLWVHTIFLTKGSFIVSDCYIAAGSTPQYYSHISMVLYTYIHYCILIASL